VNRLNDEYLILIHETKIEAKFFSFLPSDGNMMCKVCQSKDINCVSLPCGHMSTCVDCINEETKCRVCNKKRSAYVEVFLS
jgi:hypothetical protein